MKTQICKVLVAVGVVLLGADATAATDTKTFPGSVCLQTNGSDPAYSHGSSYNPHPSATMDVMCPLLRDSTRLQGGSVWVKNSAPGAHLPCAIHAESTSGSWFTSDDKTMGSATPSGIWEVLFIPSIDGVFDYYYVTCTLPAATWGNSHIAYFEVVESDS
jgi:hypothetical protein